MNSTKPYILIVDDIHEDIRVMGNTLRKKRYTVEAAQSGKTALDMISKRKPELILLDVTMPGMDGFDVCKKLKANDETKDIPVIFLTARVETQDIVHAFNMGAADYITKPFNPSELLARVSTHLEIKKNRDIIVDQNRKHQELLHVLCHDLATPFNSIVTTTSIIETIEQIEELKEIIALINRSAKQGIEIIKLVRNMRALHEGKLKIGVCNLNQAVKEAYFMLKNVFVSKEITFKTEIADNLQVMAEPISLVNSVVSNLLTNAVKFSYNGSTVIVGAKKVKREIEFSVKDNGIGMNKALCNSLFEVSRHTTRKGTKGEIGTGFGMPLVQKFIVAYGGSITVKSTDKKENPDSHGTIVTIMLKAA